MKNKSPYHRTNNNRNRAIRKRAYIEAYLETHTCIDCGESDKRCLTFDHVRGSKIQAISKLVNGSGTITQLKTEIGKCEVRCANCHLKKTFPVRTMDLAKSL